jgi:hypothetical protein
MDRPQAVSRFVRNNLKILLSGDPFPDDLYKRTKRQYFFVQLNNTAGTPRDADVADECLMYLLKTGQIKDREKLDHFLQLPFFRKHVRQNDAYVQYLEVSVVGKSAVVVDPAQMENQEYRKVLEGKIRKKVVEEETEEIRKKIEEKRREYDSLPSVLDRDEFHEPEPEAEVSADEFVPWWKQLGLTADPFPSEVGLHRITKELYEKVVYKSTTFEKYLYYAKNTPSELFKNTIFFGEFGSGKTTFFQYLQYVLIGSGIQGVYVALYGEPDPHSFRIRFQKNLLDELCEIHESIKGTNPKSWLTTSDPEETIISIMKNLKGKDGTANFVVFVDDLHKDKDNFATAMTFVSSLQTFRARLEGKDPDLNIAFYIAGSLEWELAIKNNARYSGSFSAQEDMPVLTPEASKEMLDRRFEAYASNTETRRTVDIERVRQIHRYIQNNHLSLTFRQFIQTVISEFKDGKFDLFTTNPIQIPKNKLVEIETVLNSDGNLRSSFDTLLANIEKLDIRQRCIDALVRTFLEREISEESNYFKGNVRFFKRLLEAKLIQKLRRGEHQFSWVISSELLAKNNEIREKYNLSIEDYLPQIYGGRIVKVGKTKSIEEEIERIKFFLRSPAAASEVKPFIAESIGLHETIVGEQGLPDTLDNADLLVGKCKRSLALLTRAAMVSQALTPAALDDDQVLGWWMTSWRPMEEVSEFVNVCNDRNRKPEERASRARNFYRQAYVEIFDFTRDQCDKAKLFRIVSNGLTNTEIGELNEVRDDCANGKFFDAADKICKLNERKLRLFLLNVFRVLYGEDIGSRIKRLDKHSRSYIADNIRKDNERGFSIGRNEFEQLNRSDYKSFIVPDGEPVARQNWSEVFSHVFSPLSSIDVKDFLDKFAEFNIQVSHSKESSITLEQQARVFDYIQRSQEFIRKLNNAYVNLLRTGLLTGSNPGEFYFSFNKGHDKMGLKPIFVDKETALRLSKLLADKSSVQVNLEDWDHIEQYYSVSYPVFMAFLARLAQQSPEDLEVTKVKIQLLEPQGPIITFSVHELTQVRTKTGTRLFTREELREFLRKDSKSTKG